MPESPAALTVDLEWFTQTPAYRTAVGDTDERAVGIDGLEFILDEMRSADATATFFAVSRIAEERPDVVKRVVDHGHELASHTHTHRHLTELTAQERSSELKQSRRLLSKVGATTVRGFRAPSFDIGPDHFSEIKAAGYEYDSSVVPSRSIPGWYGGEFDTIRPTSAAAIQRGSPPEIREVPVAVMPGVRLPLTGTWIRFFGVRYTILGMRSLARRGIAPVLYVHPWELVDLPKVEGVPSRVYWRTGAYLRRAIRRILAEPFEFTTTRALADSVEVSEQKSEGTV